MGSPAVKDRTLDKLHVINDDGSRHMLHPADVKGVFTKWRGVVHIVLIVVYAALPWIEIGGHPAILIDIAGRHFFFFGAAFNAQDFYLAFPILTGIGFSLIVTSALAGRLWCGWACPQTVFLEGIFRKIERFIDGPRSAQIKLAKAPWTAEKVIRRGIKHALWIFVSINVAHIFLSYFVPREVLFSMVTKNPMENLTPFLWMSAISIGLYVNFWWFREQMCLIICPYGRMQSALQDDDTMVIGYDAARGEPRGKAKDPNAGDCVDCKRCVVVCPTGIDIRNGLQLECIGCAACVDACNEVMTKLKRPTGLVRYDSYRGLNGQKRRFWRPRVFAYGIAGAVGLGVAIAMVLAHTSFEANVLRTKGLPYVVTDDRVSNQVMLHLINKGSKPTQMHISVVDAAGVKVTLPKATVDLGPLKSVQLPVLMEGPKALTGAGQNTEVVLKVEDKASQSAKELRVRFLGPGGHP